MAAHAGDIPVIIPPHVTERCRTPPPTIIPLNGAGTFRDGSEGGLGWQEETSYGRRSLVETAMGPYKTIIARGLPGQRTEAAVGVAVLNHMLHAGRPNSDRSPRMAS